MPLVLPAADTRPDDAALASRPLPAASEAVEPEEAERARIWDFRFLAAAASASFCSCAAVLGGAEFMMAVLATLLLSRRGERGGKEPQWVTGGVQSCNLQGRREVHGRSCHAHVQAADRCERSWHGHQPGASPLTAP